MHLGIWFGLCWEMGMHKRKHRYVGDTLKIALDICYLFLVYRLTHLIGFYRRQHFPFILILLKGQLCVLVFHYQRAKNPLHLTWLTPSRHRTASYFLSHPYMNNIVPYSLLYLLTEELVCWQILDKLCWVSHRSFPY